MRSYGKLFPSCGPVSRSRTGGERRKIPPQNGALKPLTNKLKDREPCGRLFCLPPEQKRNSSRLERRNPASTPNGAGRSVRSIRTLQAFKPSTLQAPSSPSSPNHRPDENHGSGRGRYPRRPPGGFRLLRTRSSTWTTPCFGQPAPGKLGGIRRSGDDFHALVHSEGELVEERGGNSGRGEGLRGLRSAMGCRKRDENEAIRGARDQQRAMSAKGETDTCVLRTVLRTRVVHFWR